MPRLKKQIIEPMIPGTVIGAVHAVSRSTVKRWCEAGQFASVIWHDNGTVSIPLSAYQSWVDRHRLQYDQTSGG